MQDEDVKRQGRISARGLRKNHVRAHRYVCRPPRRDSDGKDSKVLRNVLAEGVDRIALCKGWGKLVEADAP